MIPDTNNISPIDPAIFLKISMYAYEDKIFLEEEITVWSWRKDENNIDIKDGRERSFKGVSPLSFNIRKIGDQNPKQEIVDSTGGVISNNEYVYAQDSEIHFKDGGYIEILPPRNAKGKDVNDPVFWTSRDIISRHPRQAIVNDQGNEITSVGKNIYIEVEFSAVPPIGQTLSPILFYEQKDPADLDNSSYIFLAEKQESDHFVYWKMFDGDGTWSNEYKIDKCSDPSYLLTVNLDKDRYIAATNAPQAKSPYFEILVDAIPVSDIRTDNGASLLASDKYRFNLEKYPYIGYARVIPSPGDNKEVTDEDIEPYTFEGIIKRLVFDPNAVCPC